MKTISEPVLTDEVSVLQKQLEESRIFQDEESSKVSSMIDIMLTTSTNLCGILALE